MKNLFVITFYHLFICSGLFAQQTMITGSAPGAEGKKITLTKPGDLVTFVEKKITSTIVDSTGQFTLTCNPGETIYANIYINFHKSDIFLEPGRSYRVKIAPMDYNDYKEVNPFIQSQNLQMEIMTTLNDLNILITDFSSLYDSFILENFDALYRDRNKAKLDTFRVKVRERYNSETNPYFTQYMFYKLASLEQLTQSLNQVQLAKKYFVDKPVLYENLEYMDFFNSFFSKYMTVTSRELHKIDYLPLFRKPDPYTSFLKTLALDSLLKNEQLRELVLLKGLMEIFNMPNFNQNDILALLNAVQMRSKYPGNRVVAEDMIKYLTKLKPGTPAPDFTLLNLQKDSVSLKDFQGKPLLICFYATYCQGCLSEMDIMKTLYDKYKDRMYFVGISADKSFLTMRYFTSKKKEYTWTFLHIGDRSDLLKEYDVRSFPLFVLIGKNGMIYQYPADYPSSGLETTLAKLLEE